MSAKWAAASRQGYSSSDTHSPNGSRLLKSRLPATKKSPKLYRIEQYESLTVSNILALHRWAGWVDGIYYLAVSLMMALLN